MSTTLVLRRFTNTTRVLNNGLAVKVKQLEESGAPFEEIAPLASGRRLKAAFETGNLDDGVLTIGQAGGILHDVLPLKEDHGPHDGGVLCLPRQVSRVRGRSPAIPRPISPGIAASAQPNGKPEAACFIRRK